MPTILIIRPHSFVDLITNSSSELFVCSTDKTVEAVKEIIEKLIAMHGELSGSRGDFTSMFGAIEVAKYDFDYAAIPWAIKEEYESYHDNPTSHVWTSNSGFRSTDRFRELERKDRASENKHNTREKGLYDRDAVEYDRRCTLYRKDKVVIWKEWNEDKIKAEATLFKHFLSTNGLDYVAEVDKTVKAWVKKKRDAFDDYLHFDRDQCPALAQAYDEFSHLLSYGITIKKGNILVHSASDNSIDFELFGPLESYLGAERYHIG